MNKCFIDRELSWIEFNYRVLKQADDKNTPLLERLNFLNIYESNMDEFFMVRVGSLTHRNMLMPEYRDPKTGWTTDTQLKKILKAVANQQKEEAAVYKRIYEDLKSDGIEIVDFNKISKLDESIAKRIYSEVKDLLAPKIIDEKHSIQFMGNMESYVASYLQKGDNKLVGIVSLYRIPKYRVFETDSVKKVFLLPELVAHFAKNLYKKYTVKESCIVRLTRNADVFVTDASNYSNTNLKENMEKLLKKRKRQQPVRMQISGKPSVALLKQITKYVGIEDRRVYMYSMPLELGFSSELGPMPQLKYVQRKQSRGIDVQRGHLIPYLKTKDILLSYPYHSMDAFVDLIYEAADNRAVKSIKITLYRLSYNSKVAMALAYAADKGKDVLCLLELRARFDERNNIDYSEMLTQAGCRVIYGLPDMKVHAKICLITMANGRSKNFTYITQIGTGNYNEKTAAQYCDLTLITCNTDIAMDSMKVFDALEHSVAPQRTEHLMTAPYGYKQKLLELLEDECEKGDQGFVSIKVNSINDIDVMQELIKCSKAGVHVELFVRGICCIIPGIKGYTENITVKSIIGRYLEHSRILIIGSGKKARIFMGSGDLLNRNTSHRVEVLAEVKSTDARNKILYLMDAIRKDSENAWMMNKDGTYTKLPEKKGTASQEVLYKYFSKNK